MSKENGGPAFPHPSGWRRDPEISDGMTLRDYFAAKAMASFASVAGFSDSPDDGQIAHYSYALADAMLAERSKP